MYKNKRSKWRNYKSTTRTEHNKNEQQHISNNNIEFVTQVLYKQKHKPLLAINANGTLYKGHGNVEPSHKEVLLHTQAEGIDHGSKFFLFIIVNVILIVLVWHQHTLEETIVALACRVPEVGVGVTFRQDSHAQPAEVAVAAQACHLVTAVNLLHTNTPYTTLRLIHCNVSTTICLTIQQQNKKRQNYL